MRPTARRLPIEQGYRACYDLILEAMRQDACASIVDFQQVFGTKTSRHVPAKIVLDLLTAMEKDGRIERRYTDAMMRDNPANYLWFPVDTDIPIFHRQRRLSATDRMSLYHGDACDEKYYPEIGEKDYGRLNQIRFGNGSGEYAVVRSSTMSSERRDTTATWDRFSLERQEKY